jgi:cobalt-zinc-cadmium efflux system membrane fusion protein
MDAHPEHEAPATGPDEIESAPIATSAALPAEVPLVSRVFRKVVIGVLLSAVILPPLAGFYSYFSGVPLHLLAGSRNENEATAGPVRERVTLVPGQAHTVKVPDEVCTALGICRNHEYSIALAQAPTSMRPLVLPGSTMFDPSRLARIRARFAPARVVELAQVHDFSWQAGSSEFRELRQGDSVQKGGLLGVFYSVDVGSKKNDLLDALVQLELDQKIFDRVEKNRNAVPEVFYLTQLRAVQGDRNNINRALNNLKLWDIPQDEIDALHVEAQKISSDKDGWSKTPEGIWVKGEKQPNGEIVPGKAPENPWGRVTLRAPFDGVIVEKNVHIDEMVVDNTVNLFQIADVSRLLVVASCPEDALPTLEALSGGGRRWTVRTAGVAAPEGLPGTIDEIGYIIDPNQHTAVIKGYVENPGKRLRAGQYVAATVEIPPPHDVVEIPTDAVIDDGREALVLVQPDAGAPIFQVRRVEVTHHFEHSVFIRSAEIPEAERLTMLEAQEHLLPKEALRPGERILLNGALELKAAIMDLEEEEAARHALAVVTPTTDH